MKKGNLFSSVICLSALLLISCGSQIKNASVSVNLDSALLSKAFPESLINSRAAESEPVEEGEVLSAQFKVSGDYSYEETQNFTKENGISFELKNLMSGITIDISLDLLYNEKILYSGTIKNHVVKAGTNELTLILKPTTEFNPFTQATISYKSDFGEVAAKVVKIGYQLTEADLPVLEAENMIFVGWFIGDGAAVAGTIIDVDTEIVAKWSEVVVEPEPEITTAKVTFVYGAETEEKEFDIGYVLKAEDLPVIDETLLSDFVGWYDEAGIKVEAGYEIKADVKIVAKGNTVTIIFDTDGGSEVKPVIVEIGSRIEKDAVKNPTKDGYVFAGWYLDDNVFSLEKIITNDVTLKAKWNVVENEFPVIAMEMQINGEVIENGGFIPSDYNNLILNLKTDSSTDQYKVIARMSLNDKVIEDDSYTLNSTCVFDFNSLLRGERLVAGTYTVSFRLKKGDLISKNTNDYTFTIVDIDSIDSGVPQFKIEKTSLSNSSLRFDVIFDDGNKKINFLDYYDVIWSINGSKVCEDTLSMTVTSYNVQYIMVNGKLVRMYLQTGDNPVICEIRNKYKVGIDQSENVIIKS